MIDAEPLPDAPALEFHHRVLYRLVVGAPGVSTRDLQLLYEAIAPVAYQGTLEMPVASRRYRRSLLRDLRDHGVVDSHPSPRGVVWLPHEDVVDTEIPQCQGANIDESVTAETEQ